MVKIIILIGISFFFFSLFYVGKKEVPEMDESDRRERAEPTNNPVESPGMGTNVPEES